jgi:hypothetical protein
MPAKPGQEFTWTSKNTPIAAGDNTAIITGW